MATKTTVRKSRFKDAGIAKRLAGDTPNRDAAYQVVDRLYQRLNGKQDAVTLDEVRGEINDLAKQKNDSVPVLFAKGLKKVVADAPANKKKMAQEWVDRWIGNIARNTTAELGGTFRSEKKSDKTAPKKTTTKKTTARKPSGPKGGGKPKQSHAAQMADRDKAKGDGQTAQPAKTVAARKSKGARSTAKVRK